MSKTNIFKQKTSADENNFAEKQMKIVF